MRSCGARVLRGYASLRVRTWIRPVLSLSFGFLLLSSPAFSQGAPGPPPRGEPVEISQPSALMEAASSNCLDQARQLLQNGVFVDPRDKDGYTALLWAVLRYDSDMVDLLLKWGADPNVITSNGAALLNMAANRDAPDIVRAMLDHGADPNIRGRYGLTPLMRAAQMEHLENVCLLLEHGADINAKDEHGVTALMIVAMNAGPDMVRLLLLEGADTSLRNERGESAGDIAKLLDRPQISLLLESAEKPSAVQGVNPPAP